MEGTWVSPQGPRDVCSAEMLDQPGVTNKRGEVEGWGFGHQGVCLGMWRDPARLHGFPAKLMRVLAAGSNHWQEFLL